MKVLVVQVAALGWNLVERYGHVSGRLPLQPIPIAPPFPAVTCTAQAVFRTALQPADTGIICNGRFDRTTRRTEFWNQSARTVQGARIWANARSRGHTVGLMFWQQILGEDVDLVLSPAPIHKHHGGMIQDCYSHPEGLYGDLCRQLRSSFKLRHYWGPLASAHSSQWIAAATQALMTTPNQAPDILFTYLPHLDYAMQRHGPDHPRTEEAFRLVVDMLGELTRTAQNAGYEVVFWGDYAVTAADRPVFPNRLLLEAGLFRVRHIRAMTYPDLYASRAFAMVDHQIAHVYVAAAGDIEEARQCLESAPGIECVETSEKLPHPESGELILTASPGSWFAYPWWDDPDQAPDYAAHVDIHSKIGFDPCELFWGWPPLTISLDPSRVKGTHGRDDQPVCLGTSLPDLLGAASVRETAKLLQGALGND